MGHFWGHKKVSKRQKFLRRGKIPGRVIPGFDGACAVMFWVYNFSFILLRNESINSACGILQVLSYWESSSLCVNAPLREKKNLNFEQIISGEMDFVLLNLVCPWIFIQVISYFIFLPTCCSNLFFMTTDFSKFGNACYIKNIVSDFCERSESSILYAYGSATR